MEYGTHTDTDTHTHTHTHTHTQSKLKNAENERKTLQGMEYGKKSDNHGK